jgi:hypothetical protein
MCEVSVKQGQGQCAFAWSAPPTVMSFSASVWQACERLLSPVQEHHLLCAQGGLGVAEVRGDSDTGGVKRKLEGGGDQAAGGPLKR